MTDTYTISTADGVTCIHMRKKASLEDVRQAFDEMSRSNPSHLRLWNLEAGWDLTTAQIKEFATYTRANSKSEVKVAVVTNEDLSYGLTRMFNVYREDGMFNQRNFHSLPEAMAWLKEQ